MKRLRPGGWAARLALPVAVTAAALIFLWPSPGERTDHDRVPAVTLCAAASLADPLGDITTNFTAAGGAKVNLALGGSAALARQIKQGAPCDLFISADRIWVDALRQRDEQDRGEITGHTPIITGNRLSLAARTGGAAASPRAEGTANQNPPGATAVLAGLLADGRLAQGRLAIADPAAAPLGRYTRNALQEAGLWQSALPFLARYPDARAARAAVESGATDWGVVYASDTARSLRLREVGRFNAETHPPIAYVAAKITGHNGRAQHSEAADRLMAYLTGRQARSVFTTYGLQSMAENGPAPRRAETAAGVQSDFPPGHKQTEEWLSGPEKAALLLSLKVALAAVAVSLPFGILIAWALARYRHPVMILLDGLVYLPLVLPPVAVGYLLLAALGRASPLGQWLEQTAGLSLAFSWRGAAVAAAVMAFPLLVRSIRLSLEHLDPRMEAAARSLGATPLAAFHTVTLPLIMPGVITGAMLAFARALGEFGATITFVSNIPGATQTLPLLLYATAQSPGGEAAALRLVAISCALSLAALAASEILSRQAAGRRSGGE